MQTMTKGRRLIAAASMILLPCLGLLSLMSSPRWGMLRAVDMVQLLGSGACLGVGFMLAIGKPSKE
jgi:hypothetical protein